MGWFHRFISAVPAAVVGGLALAPAAAQETPTFSTDVELVTVDAVVLDGDGEPVAGLGPEDFELRDEGELREILSFEALDIVAEPVPLSREARRVATNVDIRPGRILALFWDDVHLTPPFAERAKEALRPWLTDRLAKGDRVVLASAGGAWRVAQDGQGAEALLEGLDVLKGEQRLAHDPEHVSDYEAVAISELNDGVTYGVVYRRFVASGVCGGELLVPCQVLPRAREVAFTVRRRLEATLRALAHLADVLAVGRGRKSIVLVSEGFLQHPDSSREFAQVQRAAQRANAVLSVLDPAGSPVMPGLGPMNKSPPAPGDQGLTSANALADQAGSEVLARDTGGLVLRANDLTAGLERIARESQTHYLLGFAPAPDAEAGAFRRISLKVHRSGLKPRARTGYTVGGERLDEPERELRRTLDAPFDLPGHPLRVASWVFDPRSPDLSRVVIGVDVAPPPATGGPGAEQRKVDVFVEVQGGRRSWRQGRELVFEPRARSGESGEDKWQLALLEVELPAGTFRARAVVRGQDGHVSGAVAHVFEVPAADAWHVSTPLLSPSLLAGPEGKTAIPSPTTRREFEVGGTLHGQLAVYATPGEPDSAADRLSGSWSLRRTDAAGPERRGPLSLAAAGEGAVACRFGLSLAGLAAGDYEIALRVRDGLEGRELVSIETVTLTAALGDAESSATREASPGSESATAQSRKAIDPELASLLERAGRYVVEYEQSFSNLVAEETYIQWMGRTRRRITRADLVFVRLPGDFLWGSFRDVFEVDGQTVRDRDARLERLFLEPTSSGIERAKEILRESAAFNIGPAVRNINLPTLPLAFLHPRNQGRFVFERKGQRRIAGILCFEVRFEEIARPTLVRTGSGDLPTKGRFWIDPHRGTVLRTETRFLFWRSHATASIATEYRPEAALAMWVPSEMREEYQDSPGASVRLFRTSTDALARYSNFRRFGVTVDEDARLLEPEGP